MEYGILIGGIVGILMVVIGYFLFPNRRDHLHKWTLYWGFTFLSYISFGGLLYNPSVLFFEIVFSLSFILAAFFLVSGVYDFFGKQQPGIWKYILLIVSILTGLRIFTGNLEVIGTFSLVIIEIIAYSDSARLFFKYSDRIRLKIMGFLAGGLVISILFMFLFFTREWYFAWNINNVIFVTLLVCFGFGLFINSYENLEYKLKQSQERYKTLFEAIGSTVIAIEKDGTISVINQQGEELLGYQKEELEGKKSYFEFVAPEDRDRVREQHRKVVNTKHRMPCSYEFTLIDKERNYKQVDVTENLISNSKRSVVSILDITERKKMTKKIKRNRDKLEKLHEIVFKMSQINTEERVYELIVDTIKEIFEIALAAVLVKEGDYLVVKASTEGIETQNISVSNGIAGTVHSNNETLLITDWEKIESIKPTNDNYNEVISTPLGSIGVVQVISTKRDLFSSADVKLVELLANHTAEAIERIRSKNKIEYMSFHDVLTGLYNRAYVESTMDRLASSQYLPTSIVSVDVNGLKLVNDAFGHDNGDKLLTTTARVLEKSCRDDDIVARLGGDEFIILLPRTNKEEVKVVSKRIKHNCAEVSSLPVPLSVAVGEATKENEEWNLWEVYKKADERMYNDKVNGGKAVEKKLLNSLFNTLKKKSCETTFHNLRLQRLGFEFGEALGFSFQELEKLSLVILFHDLGKVAIEKELLINSKGLSDKKRKAVRKHPEVGYRIVSTTEEYAHIASEILYHHEHWDGSGYPEGLHGEEIPFLSRVMAIIDAYEVMTSGRPYREKMTVTEARKELSREAGRQFDPQLVETFLNCNVADRR